MSNSTTLLDTISSTQANKEVVVNALLDAASPSMLWGRHASATSGLTWGYYGGWFNGAQIANGTVTLTASATNYVSANASTGAVSVSTTSFPAGAIPLYSIVTGASTVTSYTDQRTSGAGSGGGSSTLAGLSDVALSSPTSGQALVYNGSKWANATLSTGGSATAPVGLVSYLPGAVGASAVIMKAITPIVTAFPASLTGSFAKCDTAPTASVTCPITQNGTSIGSVNWAAGATNGTFTFSSAVTTALGDVIVVQAPSSADATFAGPNIALLGSVVPASGTIATYTAAHTIAVTDNGGAVIMNSSSAVSQALPTPTGSTGNFPAGFKVRLNNIGTGVMTITVPSGLSLDGVANGTLTRNQFQSAEAYTDGTNWFTFRSA